ncbi:MATE family efflux transporter [Paenibacillus sp. TRM 82003]|nr:MATE family efflux transporter [Paenibacillus sp. TRM 82003]
MTTVLQANRIFKSYSSSVQALHDVSLDIGEGESLGIVGESGSGKSTLGKIVLGLERADRGEVLLDGANLASLKGKQRKEARRQVQAVFQDPGASLNPKLPIWKSVVEPLENYPDVRPSYLDAKDRTPRAMAAALLRLVGLSDDVLNKYPHQISGGQRQRVAIARGVALRPKLLVCDEPTSSLDVSVQAQILNLLKELKEAHRLSYFYISHDLASVRFLCDRIAVLQGGRLVDLFPTEALFSEERHPYTRSLTGGAASMNPAWPTHRTYLLLSLPLITSALSTPLLGAVDTAVVGQLGDPSYIGAVAVGALIFNYLYWLLGFLRVSTSGFTAQAEGAGDAKELAMAFVRPFLLGLAFGLAFVALQTPILDASLYLLRPSEGVAGLVEAYYSIRIWGAPLSLANYAVYGWLIGRSRVKAALWMQLGLNGMNIALDMLFVIGFGWGVEGVAWATLISEAVVFAIGAVLVWRSLRRLYVGGWEDILDGPKLLRMLKVNRDLFLRTCCLLAVFGLFTAAGAGRGDATLAANAILLQITLIISYLFDGMANASGILTGKACGAKDEGLLRHTIKLGAIWSFVASAVVTVGVACFGEALTAVFTRSPEVASEAARYWIWLLFYPAAIFWGLLLNGIFNGATLSRPVRDSMAVSMLVFVGILYGTQGWLGNHGLWLAFLTFSLLRTLLLWRYVPQVVKLAQ